MAKIESYLSPMSFSEFQLHPDLLKGVKELGFTRPTPIQSDAIPAAMTGRDVLACAMTGSGKTMAFLLRFCIGCSSSGAVARAARAR